MYLELLYKEYVCKKCEHHNFYLQFINYLFYLNRHPQNIGNEEDSNLECI